jgi:hypothetical protein
MVSDATLNVGSLKSRFETQAYLSPHSDIVALMVLDHQAHMTNLLTRMGWETRLALHQEQLMQNSPDYPPDQDPDLLSHRLADAAREFVDYLLFIDEATLTGKIQGTSGFAEKFAAQGPRDGQGRSLRQFDLEKRLFRYPCSFMIYSRAFDGLPAEAREAIYQRMWRVLSGEEKGERYARLSLSDRRDIVEILRETKKGLPDYFQSVGRYLRGNFDCHQRQFAPANVPIRPSRNTLSGNKGVVIRSRYTVRRAEGAMKSLATCVLLYGVGSCCPSTRSG